MENKRDLTCLVMLYLNGFRRCFLFVGQIAEEPNAEVEFLGGQEKI